MKRTRYFTLATLLICAILFWLLVAYPRYAKHTDQQNEINALKNLKLLTLDSVIFIPVAGRNSTILIYFNSTCDYCVNEAAEIREMKDSFEGITVMMVSSEPIALIREFSIQQKLNNETAVVFFKINPEAVDTVFGFVSVPHTFVYSDKGKLLKEISGESKLAAILNVLQ